MSLYPQASGSKQTTLSRVSEFDVLKASHKFLREDDEASLTWEDEVAKKYYANLYREFAVCDLKHYKSGNFALRWRSESEVLSGAGEETCGNTRCTFHETSQALPMPPLSTVELPFAYEEHGENKSALVKVVLCGKCLKKLMYKREKEKERQREEEKLGQEQNSRALVVTGDVAGRGEITSPRAPSDGDDEEPRRSKDHGHSARSHRDHDRRRSHERSHKNEGRRRSSRSRSPKRRHSHRRDDAKEHRRSPHS